MRTSLPEQIDYSEHAADVLAEAAQLIRSNRKFALITSVAIEGGAARDVGSLALVADNGRMVGYLSNGCIDRDVRHQAMCALDEGVPRVVRYGAGSPFMDLQLPCGGALVIAIDPTPDGATILDAAWALAERRTARLSVTSPTGDGAVTFDYAPKARIALAGRGAILRAVAEVAHATGFDVAVLSPDEEDLRALEKCSVAHSQHLLTPSAAPDLACVDQYTSLLTLFHDHDWEPCILMAALETPAFFIGCLGSRRTQDQRLAKLSALGVSEERTRHVHGPIGLVPSLRNAQLIAVSAIAQIASVLPKQITKVS